MENHSQNSCIIKLPTVMHRTGLSRSSVYLKIAQNEFPRPIRLGKRGVGWLENEVLAWVQSRIAESRGASA